MLEDRPALIRKIDDHDLRVRDLERITAADRAVIDQRLLAGQKAFDDLRAALERTVDRIAEITPRPASPLRVASLVLGVVAMAGGALWGLSQKLSEKEDRQSAIERMVSHDSRDHGAVTEEIRRLRGDQTEQRQLIKEQGQKIDRVLERLPKGKP